MARDDLGRSRNLKALLAGDRVAAAAVGPKVICVAWDRLRLNIESNRC
jgi:hypothetical protein